MKKKNNRITASGSTKISNNIWGKQLRAHLGKKPQGIYGTSCPAKIHTHAEKKRKNEKAVLYLCLYDDE